MVGECFINNKDTHTTWGITFGAESFTNLLTFPPLKPYIENKSALLPGKQVLNDTDHAPNVDERDVQLTFNLHARNLATFLQRYESFMEELHKGKIELRTKYQSGKVYRLNYISCVQFAQFNGRLGKFILKLNEPNPADRNAD